MVKQEAMETEENVAEVSQLVEPSVIKEEYEELCQLVNPIAQPLAGRKIAKKIYKLVKKSSAHKDYIRYGLADVQKAFRKDDKGIVILAGNVTPIDIYSHIPAICEEKQWAYIYTPSREHLGLAAGHKRPSIALLIKKHDDYATLYDEVEEAINSIVLEDN